MENVSLSNLFCSFLRLGTVAFGGPAIIPYMRKLALSHKWVDEHCFDDGVAFCQTIPGATAMQAAAYVGLKANGITGAVASFIGFGLPAFALMMILSALYARFHTLPAVISAFSGLHAVVIAIMANATVLFGKTAIKNRRNAAIAAFCAALFGAAVNPILVIAAAGFAGFVTLRNQDKGGTEIHITPQTCYFKLILAILLVFGLGLAVLFFVARPLFDIGFLMARIDLLAFGGGFASVPLMFHYVVQVHSWMDGPTFFDGIVLGQITPGPIVITATYIGYLLAGPIGGIIATLSVFLPSFLMVVALAPYFDRLRAKPAFRRIIAGILCSFVGFLAVVTFRFAGGMNWNLTLIVLATLSFIALLFKTDILWVVVIGTLASILLI